MKQSVKNVIMIGMAAVLIGTSAVTISYAVTGARMQSRPEFSQNGEQRQNGSPFENFDGERNGMPDGNRSFGGNSQQSPDQNSAGGNAQQQMPDQKDMPQAPGQNNNNGSAQQQSPDNSQGDSAQQTPDKSENGGNSQQSPDSSGSSSENGNAPQKNTSTESDGLSLNTAAVGAQSSEAAVPMRNFGKNAGIFSGLCYAFAAVQIAIILAIIIYLILSKFNKISFNTVISNMRNNQ